MRRLAIVVLPLVALAACGHEAEQETQTTVTRNGVTTTTITKRAVASTGGGFKVDSDKLKANIEIPGLSFGGDHLDLGGMKFFPGTTVKGVHIHAVDTGGVDRGEVVIDFVSPAAPATVARSLANEARGAGYTVTTDAPAAVAGSRVKGTGHDSFSAVFNPNGDATVGQLTMTGAKS